MTQEPSIEEYRDRIRSVATWPEALLLLHEYRIKSERAVIEDVLSEQLPDGIEFQFEDNQTTEHHMMIHDPNNMTEREVAEKWADFMDMDADVSDRLGFLKRDTEPIPREEMIKANMIFIGNVPVVQSTSIDHDPK